MRELEVPSVPNPLLFSIYSPRGPVVRRTRFNRQMIDPHEATEKSPKSNYILTSTRNFLPTLPSLKSLPSSRTLILTSVVRRCPGGRTDLSSKHSTSLCSRVFMEAPEEQDGMEVPWVSLSFVSLRVLVYRPILVLSCPIRQSKSVPSCLTLWLHFIFH